MRVGTFLDRIEKSVGNHFTRSQLLTMVNTEQNYILGKNIEFMCRILPITTSSGTLEYSVDAPGTRARFIGEVYTNTPVPGTNVAPDDRDSSGVPIYLVNNIDSTLGDPVTLGCTFTFAEDPGDTTDTYYAKVFDWPEQMGTEDANLTIPDQYLDVLRYRILMIVEEIEYGVSQTQEENFRKANKLWLAYANLKSNRSMVGRWTPKGVTRGLYS